MRLNTPALAAALAVVAVALACAGAAATASGSSLPAFGHSLLPLFQLDPTYVNLNHGSYGSVPKSVTDNETAWEKKTEFNPDAFFRYNVWGFMDSVRRALADLLSCDWEDLVFIPNASAGVNTVIRSLQVPDGQKILYLNEAYGMVKSTIAYVDPDRRILVNLTMPATHDSILATVEDALKQNQGQIYVASFSHISSLPAILMPVAELIELCHSYGVMVMIDGAHALGHVNVNLTDLNADFWLGNGHKWLYSPKGSAVLWVRKDRQSLIKPLTISWDEGQGADDFQNMFSYQGTTSYSAYLAMAAALDFRASLGGSDRIQDYIHNLAVQAGAHLASQWNTDVLFSDPSMYGAMVDVRVPTTNATLAAQIPQLLLSRFNTWVPVYDIGAYGGTPGNFYVRVSCQIYTEMSDIQYLADSMQKIISGAF